MNQRHMLLGSVLLVLLVPAAVLAKPKPKAQPKLHKDVADAQLRAKYGACTQCRPAFGAVEYSANPIAGAPPGSLSGVNAKRRAIVNNAIAAIDKSIECADPNNSSQRLGADFLVNTMRLATGGNAQLDKELRAIPHGATDWCGMIATAFAKKAGINTSWGMDKDEDWRRLTGHKKGDKHWAGPTGLKLIQGSKGIQPGDIMGIAHSNHWAVVERVTSDRIYTIDGNMKCGGIYRNWRPRSEILYYWQTVP